MRKLRIKYGNHSFCCIVMLILSACAQEAAPPTVSLSIGEINEMPAAELYNHIDSNTAPLIIDVRSSDEFDAGHIPGALNIAHSEFVDYPAESLALLPTARDAGIVVHCASGKRAAIAMDIITDAGYTNISHLSGDFNGWDAADYPVEQNNRTN